MAGKNVLASRLKKRIILQQPVRMPDYIGGFITSWDNFATVWAEITPRSGTEVVTDERIVKVKKITVVIRHLKGVNDQMRIQYGARFFNIVSILNPFEENVLLEIVAEEIR